MAGPYCLRRDAHCSTVLAQLFRDDTFADVILTAEGRNIKAHKVSCIYVLEIKI